MVDFRHIADEHFGLPTRFLFAGSPTVYGSLWTVNDLSTALLMMEACRGLIDGKGKAESLRDAQLWVRDVGAGELAGLLREKEKELRGERLGGRSPVAI